MHLHTKPTAPPTTHANKMKITIKFSIRMIDIEVDQTDTLRSLKEKIHIVDGTPIRRITLFFNGAEMEDDFRSLNVYGMRENSEVVVFLKTMNRAMTDPPTRRVSVVVQTFSSLMNEAKFPVEMNDSSRVSELTEIMVEKRMLPADEYIFVHKQRIMRDDCSLCWHGVEDGDFLYVFKGSVSRSDY